MVAGVKTLLLAQKKEILFFFKQNNRQPSTQGRHQGKSPDDHYRDLRSGQGMSIKKSYKSHLTRSYPPNENNTFS